MNNATSPLRDFARRLIDHEGGAKQAAGADLPPVVRVCEKLRAHLTTLMGKTGFQALLQRSLALGATEEPWLGTVTVDADGAWQGLGKSGAPDETKQVAEGGVVLLAQLLGLLTTFIGAHLTIRLVSEIWPTLPLDDLDLNSREAT